MWLAESSAGGALYIQHFVIPCKLHFIKYILSDLYTRWQERYSLLLDSKTLFKKIIWFKNSISLGLLLHLFYSKTIFGVSGSSSIRMIHAETDKRSSFSCCLPVCCNVRVAVRARQGRLIGSAHMTSLLPCCTSAPFWYMAAILLQGDQVYGAPWQLLLTRKGSLTKGSHKTSMDCPFDIANKYPKLGAKTPFCFLTELYFCFSVQWNWNFKKWETIFFPLFHDTVSEYFDDSWPQWPGRLGEISLKGEEDTPGR